MINKIFKTALIMALLSLPLLSMAQTKPQLKVVTFNIRSFEPDFNVTPFANLLRAQNADIIILNEVENLSSRQMVNNKYRDVVDDLASKLGMFGLFGYSYSLANKDGKLPESNYTFQTSEMYGNAILSKYPIMASKAKQLPRPPGSSDQRGVLTADILLPSGLIVRAAATHLDHIAGQYEQCLELMPAQLQNGSIPTILAGDLNMSPSSNVVIKLLEGYDRMDDDQGTFYGVSKIDYILGSKGDWRLIETRAIPSGDLSDHYAVFSKIEYIK